MLTTALGGSGMAATIDKAFSNLADPGVWEDAAGVAAGFFAPTVARNVLEGQTSMDVPDEAYGVGVVALSPYAPAYSGQIALGGGLYTIDTLLERVGLKQTVTGGNL